MKIIDAIALFILFLALLVGSYLLWMNLPTETVEFEQYRSNISGSLPLKSTQFYPNMRYKTKDIGYYVESACGNKQRADAVEAFSILSEITVLGFYENSKPEITITCSDLAPEPEQENHFVAGEGGPTEIINSSEFAVITSGKVALYRDEKCEEPQIALHEILHSLGFEHNSDLKSIMYPITDCNQKVDQYIIDEINLIYEIPPLADLVIESVVANKTGRYLNFEAVISNVGLTDVGNSQLVLLVNGEEIRTFELGESEIGAKRRLTVSNVRVPGDMQKVIFEVRVNEEELSKENNRAEVGLSI